MVICFVANLYLIHSPWLKWWRMRPVVGLKNNCHDFWSYLKNRLHTWEWTPSSRYVFIEFHQHKMSVCDGWRLCAYHWACGPLYAGCELEPVYHSHPSQHLGSGDSEWLGKHSINYFYSSFPFIFVIKSLREYQMRL